MSQSRKRRISLKVAYQCEMAIGDRCRCRCGGLLHGARRITGADDREVFFARLPSDDPHYRHLTNKEWDDYCEKQQLDLPF